MEEIRHFIDGQRVRSAIGKTFSNVNPCDGHQIGTVHEAGPDEVDLAVGAARNALSGKWAAMPVAKRMELLHRVADGINARFDEFMAAECLDTGKPQSLASHIDIPRGAANFKIFADLVRNVPTESFRMDTEDGTGAHNFAIRKPRGVIGVVAPWNLPLLLMTWKVAPALACGNTVVVKPSEETPRTATLLAEVMNEAGIPPGVYNVVHGFGEDSAGAYLTRHEDIDGITFTGETATGSAIMHAAADSICPVSFELGGKNAAVVFDDADLDKAIEGTLRSAFANCGQVCLGTERVYVQRGLFDEFVSRLAVGASNLRIGPSFEKGVNFGPLISREHREKVLAYYDSAREDGANVVVGGGVPDMPPSLAGGAWVQPTIWTGLGDDTSVVREEIFGPCCHIAPFDEEDEVVARVNDTSYGLASAIWTENLSRAHRIAPRIDVGLCWVNSWFLRDLRTPFGGSKRSGIGREGGVHGLEFYAELSNVCIKL